MSNQKGFALIWGIILIIFLIIFVGLSYQLIKNKNSDANNFRSNISQNLNSENVTWELRNNGWVPSATPPPCPDTLVIPTPVDVAKVTGILYPGQPRENGFKPHGAFRFDNAENSAEVKVPMDAQLVRGSRAFRNNENQYSFEFIAQCGIWYTVGHLLELSPKFLDIANKLPLVIDNPNGTPAKDQIFDVAPDTHVKTGEVIATKVGYAKTNNVFMDFGVLDLRKKNGKSIRSEWKQFENQFDYYGICWLEIISKSDQETLRGIFGSGDQVYGTKSDYCSFPENL